MSAYDTVERLQDVMLAATAYDGAWHHSVVLYAGLDGLTTSSHGAADRHDWGATQRSIEEAQQRHGRYQALADSLTPEQRAAVWSDTSPQAAVLRRFVR
jgi:hypothetical protein